MIFENSFYMMMRKKTQSFTMDEIGLMYLCEGTLSIKKFNSTIIFRFQYLFLKLLSETHMEFKPNEYASDLK